jgi:HNH endonuclease
MITQEKIKSLFDYKCGSLYWKVKRPHINVGDKAGYILTKGYRRIKINGLSYPEHHLIWLYHNGSLPKDQIDHINRIKDDNRIENLRECNNSENNQNRMPKKYGVYFHKKSGKYHVRIRKGGKCVFSEYHDTQESAEQAYKNFKKMYHQFFVSLE